MKRNILTVALLFSTVASFSQTAGKKLSVSVAKDKQLIVVSGDVSVDYQGYPGNELLISSIKDSNSVPDLAKGLKKLSENHKSQQDSLGYVATINNAQQVKIKITGNAKHLHISVPQDLWMLSIQAYSMDPNSKLSVNEIKTQLDIHAVMKSITVSEVTGPFIIQSDVGEIILKNIHWNQATQWKLNPPPPQFDYPYIIRSRNSDIRIFTGSDLKASLQLKAPAGKVLSDFKLTNNKDLNGGGVIIFAEAVHGNIYIQK